MSYQEELWWNLREARSHLRGNIFLTGAHVQHPLVNLCSPNSPHRSNLVFARSARSRPNFVRILRNTKRSTPRNITLGADTSRRLLSSTQHMHRGSKQRHHRRIALRLVTKSFHPSDAAEPLNSRARYASAASGITPGP